MTPEREIRGFVAHGAKTAAEVDLLAALDEARARLAACRAAGAEMTADLLGQLARMETFALAADAVAVAHVERCQDCQGAATTEWIRPATSLTREAQ